MIHYRVEGKGKKNKNWYFRAKIKYQFYYFNFVPIGKMRNKELKYWI